MSLDGAYCNALLLAYWSIRQKLNHASKVQLRRSVRTLTLYSLLITRERDGTDTVSYTHLTLPTILRV